MKQDAVLIFDIGKTNKKIMIFDLSLKVLYQEEEIFPEITDDEGFSCDDIDKVETWIFDVLTRYSKSSSYAIKAINFATYGASLMYLDINGKRLTPVYNYLKEIPESISEDVYQKYEGKAEFCRRSASPALSMLNSGFQIRWLKTVKPEIFAKVQHILHFPQYLSYLLTGKVTSEFTSIGCHTAMWDFDTMNYHPWLASENISLPQPQPVNSIYSIHVNGKKMEAGIGIHDSSASLAPYFRGCKDEFLLVSTGTWCISMNPFNHTPLTEDQLAKDCLCYMSINGTPVKSSRVFLGHMHDETLKTLNSYFPVSEDYYKKVEPDAGLIKNLRSANCNNRVFFKEGIDDNQSEKAFNLNQFKSFEEAYHQLMLDCASVVAESIELILSGNTVKKIFVTGGFSKNPIFTGLLAGHFPGMEVFTSEISNATSLGCAMITVEKLVGLEAVKIDLGLKKQEVL